ncbi:MAG: hypothetical protein V4787_27500 [Pseudomonadota bacterium]
MTMAQQFASRAALQELRTNTLAFLTNNTLTVQNVVGVDTTIQPLAFGIAGAHAKMATALTVSAQCGGPDSVVRNVSVHGTPMRLATAGAGRTAATARMAVAGGPPLWVTTRQTGCSVLILDWGAALSMVHLQPSLQADFSWATQQLMSLTTYTSRETHRYSLQMELNQVVTATRAAGPAPQRYILVQSQWRGANFYGVTGVRDNAGAWQFFLQTYTLGGVVAAVQLNWTNWNHWGAYRPRAY